MVLCSLASYQSSEVVEEKAETPSNRGRTHETNNCVLHRSPQWCNNKLPHKEKLSKRRNRVNDTHMLHEDRENCRKQKKRNAVVISK